MQRHPLPLLLLGACLALAFGAWGGGCGRHDELDGVENGDDELGVELDTAEAEADDELDATEADDEAAEELEPPPLPALHLNEVSCEEEWVELVNDAAEPIDLGAWTLVDDSNQADHLSPLPAQTLAAGAFVRVDAASGVLQFSIGCGDDSITLQAPDGRVADTVALRPHAKRLSYGRLPDGTGDWQPTVPTPGAPNRAPDLQGLLLNELRCDGDEWIELYNPGAEPVHLAGWAVADELAPTGPRHELPTDAELGPGAWLLLRPEGVDPEGYGFGIACGVDTVVLYAPDGSPVDQVLPPPADHWEAAWGRLPDGGAWGLSEPTPGAANLPWLDPTETLYDPLRIWTIDITLDAASRSHLERVPDEYVSATVQAEGPRGPLPPLTAGVRIKGRWGSARSLDQKAAFKIKFNWGDSTVRFLGLESMTLNNMVQDRSMLHEFTAYALMRAAGVPAPRVGYAWVRVNGEDYGLYANIESPDGTFLARHFASTQHLYEGAYGQDLVPELLWDFEVDEGDEAVRTDLAELMDAVGAATGPSFVADTAAVLDWNELTVAMAAEIFIGHWDGYAPTQNNYRLHSSAGGVFSLLPWGTDQTFDWHLGLHEGNGFLLQGCMADLGCRALFDQHLMALVDHVDAIDLVGQIERLAPVLRPYADADPRKEYPIESVDEGVASTIAFLRGRQLDVAAQVDCYLNGVDGDGDGHRCDDDCNDADPFTYRGADEICEDGLDQDCNGLPDDGPGCPCIPVWRGDHRYLVCIYPTSYADARQICLDQGADLLLIGDLYEDAWVYVHAQQLVATEYWFGLDDLAEEGRFVWLDGSEATYTNWSPGEPNNSGEEDCAHYWGGWNWSWNDIPCDYGLPAICEDLCLPGEDGDGDGALRCGGDCDDADPDAYPGAPELCGDGIDQNCNLEVDEGC